MSQLHYGIVLMIAMGIGAFMPPIGVGFYVTCAICETTIENSARAMIPFLVVLSWAWCWWRWCLGSPCFCP